MKLYFPDKNKYIPEKVLERLSDLRIYEYYVGEPINPGHPVKCPFHNDDSPSLHFKRMNSGMLLYNCFGCGKKGNVFKFISELHNITYGEAIHLVVDTLEGEDIFKVVCKTKDPFKELNTKIVGFFEEFTKSNLEYWNSFYITKPTLDYFNVRKCIEAHIINEHNSYRLVSTEKNPIYYYNINDKCKIYRPLNPTKKGKFYSNTSNDNLQGLNQIKNGGDILFITSSLKDVMVLYELGYQAIAPQGEGHSIPNYYIDSFKDSYERIIVFYDSDKAGYEFANKLCKEYDLEKIFIPSQYYLKDISDFIKVFGIEKTIELIQKLVNG